MLASQSQSVAVMVLVVLTAAHCQDDRRRAVTEHQLLHDRGRTIQSLKRLIWLSSAIEGLHTAQARDASTSSSEQPSRCCSRAQQQQLLSEGTNDSRDHRGAVETLFGDIFRPHIPAVLPSSDK
ncbi:parathyroid hormone 4 [Engraulis encrasicolus]|uniref:parathyroid hormone 4 n=1 Tax=Engraulis encrasicolus TaxID=184585 RepID=UPI002FD5C4AA